MMTWFSMDIARGMFAIGESGGHEKIPKVSSLCRSGGGEALKNVMKNDDFYRT